MPLENKDLFSAEFKEVGDGIRHFSTTRSGLTTFLLTVGLAAFAAYFHKQQTSPFFVVAGFTFLTAAVAVCFRFSFLTERYRKYQRILWDAARQQDIPPDFPTGVRNYHPAFREVWPKVRRDWTNWLLVAVVCVLGIGFVIAALGRDASAGVPITVSVVLVTLVAASVLLVWLRKLGGEFSMYGLLIPMWIACIIILVLTLWWFKPISRHAEPSAAPDPARPQVSGGS